MNAIRAARIRARLTQQQLAGLVGRDQSEISRIEAGKTALTVPLLLSLAKALGVRPGRLLSRFRDDAQGRASVAEGRRPGAAKAA
jgi:transcriptional regulator with XRE-family HTH domain